MHKGKMIAQGAHASLAVFFKEMVLTCSEDDKILYECRMNKEMKEWKEGSFAKIVLSSHAEIMELVCKIAEEDNIAYSKIYDNGVTQVAPGSFTAAAIGPLDVTQEKNKRVMEILSKLKLL
jgi:peptidyl-tRNA hydrolase